MGHYEAEMNPNNEPRSEKELAALKREEKKREQEALHRITRIMGRIMRTKSKTLKTIN